MGKLIQKYLDSKAIAVVQGGVEQTTELLKYKFDKILYTGNGTVGRMYAISYSTTHPCQVL